MWQDINKTYKYKVERSRKVNNINNRKNSNKILHMCYLFTKTFRAKNNNFPLYIKSKYISLSPHLTLSVRNPYTNFICLLTQKKNVIISTKIT